MNERSQDTGRDDADLASLLAKVGSRGEPAAEAMAAARVAVEAEWRAAVAARQRQRRFTTWAAVAGVAVAAVAVWVTRSTLQIEPTVVASVARVVGDVQRSDRDGRWTALAAADRIEAGTQLRTAAGGQAALQLIDGVELRLDSGTVIALADSGAADLSRGAVYVDSRTGPGRTATDFVLETPAGAVRHLGTQYEARVLASSLRVAVREGRVQVGGPRGHEGAAGELLTIREGRVERSVIAPHDDRWNWLATVTPPLRLEGRSVDEFLAWAGRETGRTVVYAAPDAAQLARTVTLSGTLDGLAPDDAVPAVLSTTSLRAVVTDDVIRVEATTR